MFKKTVIFAVALAVALTFLFSGCSGAGNSNVLRVGIDNTYPPMEYTDKDGKNVGFDIDLANAIGQKLGMKVEFVPTQWSAIFTALDSNKFDCIISSLSITDERKKSIAYTKPYISNSQVIIVKADDTTVQSEADLGEKIVAVQLGTTSEEACIEFQKKTPFKDFKKYDGMVEALNELKIGRVDTVVCDLVVGKYFVARDAKSFKLVKTTLPNEPIGIGVKLSNTALRDKIEKVLDDMRADGSLKKISDTWFGEDMTSNIE